MRVMTRPDFQGGDGRLGYWNLYGRLLNESPWVTLDMRKTLLEKKPGGPEPWALIHGRIEGDPTLFSSGGLSEIRVSHLYAQAGSSALPRVSWQLGTLESRMGDLGLYDMRPATVLDKTVGLSARAQGEQVDLLLGVGDAGYGLKGENYNTVLSAGGTLRWRPLPQVEIALGGEYFYEPEVVGNPNAAHFTPDLNYEDWIRGEVVSNWVAENPGQELNFPDPESTSADSFKAVAYLGFGNLGPLRWNSFYASYSRSHPETVSTETAGTETYLLYLQRLTDERTQLLLGNEMELAVVPGLIDVAWAVLYGDNTDGDNAILPADGDQTFASTVLRVQTYLSPTLHLLLESSLARETSKNGNRYRNHEDSLFASTDGTADTRGLEYGDADTRETWQGKAGIVLNPLGPGIYVRPSLRLLYGLQYSTQNTAFGNSFVETQDQYSEFGSVERHWHQLVALEAEAWF